MKKMILVILTHKSKIKFKFKELTIAKLILTYLLNVQTVKDLYNM